MCPGVQRPSRADTRIGREQDSSAAHEQRSRSASRVQGQSEDDKKCIFPQWMEEGAATCLLETFRETTLDGRLLRGFLSAGRRPFFYLRFRTASVERIIQYSGGIRVLREGLYESR